ncbi:MULTISPECIES: PTS sugar transporter subunit IIA [unclassified Mycoplasma]|uniref:PTS sugar transporter subunit IIA n=1 Tax=unclassified Mycoplasma TaxID=2683645 RepID=UPI00211C8C2C|nr:MULTISPECIES: PTS sugar transporter subunit IIA [unclassified Mycoplasma]UUM19528.1 PTS sugar transporter subunit IIA [Mycoplasma sp. 1578d]UUM24448.1 PTS sugar transporter subunit IIA [Mycoplasma sp. 3686d]
MQLQVKDLISEENIFLDIVAQDHDQALFKVSELLQKNGFVKEAQKFYDALLYRENLMPTALNGGIAVPHGVSSTVNKSFISIARIKEGVDWHAADKQDVKLLLILGTPRQESDCQIDVLQMISLWSLDDELVKSLYTQNDPKLIKQMIVKKFVIIETE